MKKSIILIIGTNLLVFTLIQCNLSKKEDPKPALQVPSTYDSTGYSAAVVSDRAIRTQFDNLINEVKKGRNKANALATATLQSLYTAGNPSLKSATTGYYSNRIENIYFPEISKASGKSYVVGAPLPGNEGGVFESGSSAYLLDENGLEIEQKIEKGLFAALFYHQATLLMNGTISVNTIHRLVNLFGASPAFPNTDKAVGATASGGGTHAGSPTPDRYYAAYAARRDQNDNKGLYTAIKNNLITAQAAAKGGFDAELQSALAEFRLNWEKVMAATVINYCYSVNTSMSKSSPTKADSVSAIHAYGECVGFVHGWKQIDGSKKLISDKEIDEILELLKAPESGTVRSYEFITQPATTLPLLVGSTNSVVAKLKQRYNFTDTDIEGFKKNWVNEQKR